MTPMPGTYEDDVPVLDSGMFPHVFDNILRFAPTASLLVLRGTSHCVQQQADKLLFEHLQVSATQTTPHFAVRWKGAPLGPTRYLAAEIKNSAGRKVKLKDTRVIDLAVKNPEIVLDLFTALPMVDMVRISLDRNSDRPVRVFLQAVGRLTAIRTHTMVYFSQMIQSQGDFYERLGIIPPRPLDRDLRRVVLTSYFDPSWPWLAASEPSANPLPLPVGVSEVVHILHPHSSPVRIEENQMSGVFPMGMLHVVVQVVAQTLDYATHTLVGVPELHPNWLNLSLPTELSLPELVRLAIRGEYRALHVWAPDDEVDAAVGRVAILTLDEYRHQVGQTQFDLETRE